jgi:hypothetical protein
MMTLLSLKIFSTSARLIQKCTTHSLLPTSSGFNRTNFLAPALNYRLLLASLVPAQELILQISAAYAEGPILLKSSITSLTGIPESLQPMKNASTKLHIAKDGPWNPTTISTHLDRTTPHIIQHKVPINELPPLMYMRMSRTTQVSLHQMQKPSTQSAKIIWKLTLTSDRPFFDGISCTQKMMSLRSAPLTCLFRKMLLSQPS